MGRILERARMTARMAALVAVSAAAGAAMAPRMAGSQAPQTPSPPQTPPAVGATVTAPFKVVSASGALLMEVTESGDGARLRLTGANGGEVNLGAATHGETALAVQSRESGAIWAVRVTPAGMVMNGGALEHGFVMAIDDKNQGLRIEKAKIEVAHLGVKDGKNAAVRLYGPGGKPAAQLGSNPVNQGAGTLTLSDAGGAVTGNWASKAEGASTLFTTAGGTPVFVVQPSKSGGGKMELSAAGGETAVQAGAGASGGIVCAFVPNRPPRCLDPTAPNFP